MRISILIAEGIDAGIVESAIPGDDHIVRDGVVHGLANASQILDGEVPELLLLACADGPEAVDLVTQMSAGQPQLPVVALCEAPAQRFLDSLFEAGADDVVALPATPEHVRFALEKAVVRRGRRAAGRNGNGTPGSMVCLLGPKGGVGKTMIACNLAAHLADAGVRVALVDLDLQFGDVGLALSLTPERTLFDLATSGGSLDSEKLAAYLTEHESGARVLLAPVRPDQAESIPMEFLDEVYPLLREEHELVIVDTPPSFTPEVIAALDTATHTCVVGMLDSLSIKNTKLGLETLELMGRDSEATTLVLNRANTEVGVTREDFAEIVGREPDVFVPSDRAVPRSVNEGTPIVLSKSRSGVAEAIRSLAAMYRPARNGAKGSNGAPEKRRRLPFRRGEG